MIHGYRWEDGNEGLRTAGLKRLNNDPPTNKQINKYIKPHVHTPLLTDHSATRYYPEQKKKKKKIFKVISEKRSPGFESWEFPHHNV